MTNTSRVRRVLSGAVRRRGWERGAVLFTSKPIIKQIKSRALEDSALAAPALQRLNNAACHIYMWVHIENMSPCADGVGAPRVRRRSLVGTKYFFRSNSQFEPKRRKNKSSHERVAPRSPATTGCPAPFKVMKPPPADSMRGHSGPDGWLPGPLGHGAGAAFIE